MTAQIVRFPFMSIMEAREIVSNPDLHDEASVLAACEMLAIRLPPRGRAEMTAQIVRFPFMSVMEAREIVSNPDLHDEASVLDACEMLAICGDWEDRQRAKTLHAQIVSRAVCEINTAGRRRARIGALIEGAVGAACLFGLLYLFLLFTP